jgi:hypothetical protein
MMRVLAGNVFMPIPRVVGEVYVFEEGTHHNT